jgi:hypothetical protein
MAEAFGRAGQVSITGGNDAIEIDGIGKFLRDASRANANFNNEMRKAAEMVAQNLLDKAKNEARTVTRNRQAIEVMKGMRASRDRIPTIKLQENSPFQSKSSKFTSSRNIKTRRRVKRQVTRGDVFFGAEFGGQATPRTKQFLRHRGRSGYFFWPTVRKEKQNIANEYLAAIDRVLAKLADDNAEKAKARAVAGGTWNMTSSGMVFVKD